MSRFELVGMSDCLGLAKAEKIADEIVASNPTLEFHKQMMDRFNWIDFTDKMKRLRNWDIKRSPVIYEVLVELDGKLHLIGDIDDFCEFALLNFGIYCNPPLSVLQETRRVNKETFGLGFEGQDRGGGSSIFNLSIINAPIKTLEHVLAQLLSPVSMVPPGLLFNIRIYDEVSPSRTLDGLIMELVDIASPNLFKASVTTSLPMLFYQCHLLLYMEDLSIEPEEECKDWLTRVETTVIKHFTGMSKGKSTKNCRVIIGGEGPQCYIAEIFRKIVPYHKVSYGQVITTGQSVVQKAKCEISKLTDVAAGCINRIYAYGWPGLTGAYIEVIDGVCRGISSVRGPGVEIPLSEVAANCDKLYHGFADKFLDLQEKRKLLENPLLDIGRLRKTVPTVPCNMVMADSIVNTIQLWLQMDPLTNGNSQSANKGFSAYPICNPIGSENCVNVPVPVISLGVQCCFTSSFPPGTFMVQPAICVDGIWKPLGKISEGTHRKIQREVSKLWKTRQEMIHRDVYEVGLCPDYDRMLDPDAYAKTLDYMSDEEQTEGEFRGEDADISNYQGNKNPQPA